MAAMPTMSTILLTFDPSWRTWMGLFKPSRMGPMTSTSDTLPMRL